MWAGFGPLWLGLHQMAAGVQFSTEAARSSTKVKLVAQIWAVPNNGGGGGQDFRQEASWPLLTPMFPTPPSSPASGSGPQRDPGALDPPESAPAHFPVQITPIFVRSCAKNGAAKLPWRAQVQTTIGEICKGQHGADSGRLKASGHPTIDSQSSTAGGCQERRRKRPTRHLLSTRNFTAPSFRCPATIPMERRSECRSVAKPRSIRTRPESSLYIG